jgi:DNA-binding GntR family transcriptional regulator/DNA-binding LacI/PurR family transcriptional regulator
MKKGQARKDDHPSVRVARRFIENGLRSRQFLDGDRLPPMKSLALKAGVSPAAMVKALHLLEAAGQVSIVKNHGTFAGKPEDRADARVMDSFDSFEKAPRAKWQRLRARLEQDIYGGRFAPGKELPALRDLAPMYGTTPLTLRKAMQALERAGVVHSQGRAFLVPRRAVVQGQAGILYTTWLRPELDPIWFGRQRTKEYLATLSRACNEANLRLFVSGYHPRHGFRWRPGFGGGLAEIRKVTLRGHLAFIPGVSEPDLLRLCKDLGSLNAGSKPVRVGSRGTPLAIMETAVGTPIVIPKSKEFAATRVFTILRRSAGEHVGRFLLAGGHRRIAYLSSCHLEPWSKDRLLGLKRYFESAGFPDAVKAFTISARDDMADKPELTSRLQIAESELAGGLESLEKGLSGEAMAWMSIPLRTAFELFRSEARSGYAIMELLDRMRAWGATACVAANDIMAITAMHRLRKQGVRVPEDLAFVSFDDDKHAVDSDLTSYNFNMSGNAESMLRFVLDPDKAVMADRDGSVECPGILFERGSTRRP